MIKLGVFSMTLETCWE